MSEREECSLEESLKISLHLHSLSLSELNTNSDWYDLVLSQCYFSVAVSQSDELLSSKGIKGGEQQQQQEAEEEGEGEAEKRRGKNRENGDDSTLY